MSPSVAFLRGIAIIEAISYLVLLGIAMPLKYFAGIPQAVMVAGSAHGALFVIFCFALLRVFLGLRWSVGRCAIIFLASLVPVVPFLLDRRIVEWDKS